MTNPEPMPPPRRPAWVIPAITALAVAAVVALSAVAFIAGRSANDQAGTVPGAAPSATAATLNAAGSITLRLGQFTWGANGSDDLRCQGYRGYSDIADGAPVTVTGPDGSVVAVGQLREGAAVREGDRATGCVIPFEVSDVPAGLNFYGVEISHRGRVQYPEAELGGKVELTIP